MFDDTRIDGKLRELSKELVARPMVPGFNVADAFTMRGMDETGKPGLFAAILLAPGPAPELGALTTFRALLTQRLKQLDTKTPSWPIVVQGTPEVIDGQDTIPGGREYFEQVKQELLTRQERLKAAARPTPAAVEPFQAERAPRVVKAAKAAKPRKVKVAAKARKAATARRTAKRTAARTSRQGRARR